MDTNELVEEVLRKQTWLLKESSNTQMSPSLMDLHISSRANEEYALKKLYSKDVTKHHQDGSIYIHTLHDTFKPYCNGIDARVLLLDGLRFPHCNSSPAKHFSSAVYQSMAYMFYSQLFFAGAQAMDYYNWFLAPYVHYDRLKYKEVKQIIQGFVFQLNQSNRIGAQSAFTNIGLRIECPSYLKETKGEDVGVVYQGKVMERARYTDFEEEARMIYKAFMEIMGEGDGNGAPFTFPLITTAITKDWRWSDELVDITMETTAKTGAPYFFNLTTDYLNEKYVHAMCCRLLVEHAGGVWMAGGLGSGSNKVVTINLPHIALTSKSESDFFSNLDREMAIARKALLQSNKIIDDSLNKYGLLNFLKMKTKNGAPYYDFKKRSLTFGVIGLNEALLNLLGVSLISDDGFKFGLKAIEHLSLKVKEFSKKDEIRYNLEQTPAESATHKLALKDRKRFGKRANVQGSGSEVYYTNSTHVPYNQNISVLDKVRIESEFHPYFTGGNICHIWMGESRPNPSSLKDFVKNLSNTKLAYFTFSPDYSICKNNHYTRGKHLACPKCGAKIIDHINRVVGYFTRVSGWNPGKQREYSERKRYLLK